MQDKIQDYEQLVATASELRACNKRVVHCHGVYDLLHIGHIKHLEAARRLGDVLVVTITPDRFVNKGPHRPAFNESLRAQALAALMCVDYVAVNRFPTAVELIGDMKPAFFVKGAVKADGPRDHSDAIVHEEKAVEAAGGQFVLTEEETYSSSTLINRFLDVLSPEAKTFLTGFRARYTPNEVVRSIHGMRQLKVLTIGETIIDEYVFCDAMGRTNKEAVLVVGETRTERYAGGILAVANHASGFCGGVTMASGLGEDDPFDHFVLERLKPNVQPMLVRVPGVRTMVKRRYVEEYLNKKLFEVYSTKQLRVEGRQEEEFLKSLGEALPEHDVVIVVDYGHGLLTERVVDLICERSRFLAINTQTNAGNLGFNVISKYPRADFVCLAEPEIRLEHRDHRTDTQELGVRTATKLGAKRMIITRGKNGCVCYDHAAGVLSVPAFSVKVVDRVGSGDALLSLAAPAAAMGLPMDLVGFIGGVSGAEACAVMGNQSSVEPSALFRHITSLLM